MDEMKPGRIKLGAASLELSYSQLIPPIYRGNALEITDLLTESTERRNNAANSLMQEVCAQADQHHKLLLLMPKAFGSDGLTTDQLSDWYQRRFGFVVLQAAPVILIRMPHDAAQQWAAMHGQ